jgi:membrane-associated protease RseP (regulator of RpoE activity)
MDQPYYFPNPSSGAPASPAADSNRSTVVHRLPQGAVPTWVDEQNQITTGRLLFHLLLLGLTILTTAGAGALMLYDEELPNPLFDAIRSGVIYSFTIITILTAHEMGHYIACRWYGVEATLPYFIPMPIPPVGTFGAFIKIKSPIPSRRALFDIGIAGPLAGFVFAVPAAFVAHYFATPAKITASTGEAIYFQSPLLFRFFEQLFHLPPLINLNPVMWAAWIGLLMTSLNLLPVGQLDGGHVTYAVLGPRGHRALALSCYLAVIGLALYSVRGGMWNWVVYAVILTLMLRVGHPPVVDDNEPLGRARIAVALIGLAVFILSFMPFPISF